MLYTRRCWPTTTGCQRCWTSLDNVGQHVHRQNIVKMTTTIVSRLTVMGHVMRPLQKLYGWLLAGKCKSIAYCFVEKMKIDGKRNCKNMYIGVIAHQQLVIVMSPIGIWTGSSTEEHLGAQTKCSKKVYKLQRLHQDSEKISDFIEASVLYRKCRISWKTSKPQNCEWIDL